MTSYQDVKGHFDGSIKNRINVRKNEIETAQMFKQGIIVQEPRQRALASALSRPEASLSTAYLTAAYDMVDDIKKYFPRISKDRQVYVLNQIHSSEGHGKLFNSDGHNSEHLQYYYYLILLQECERQNIDIW